MKTFIVLFLLFLPIKAQNLEVKTKKNMVYFKNNHVVMGVENKILSSDNIKISIKKTKSDSVIYFGIVKNITGIKKIKIYLDGKLYKKQFTITEGTKKELTYPFEFKSDKLCQKINIELVSFDKPPKIQATESPPLPHSPLPTNTPGVKSCEQNGIYVFTDYIHNGWYKMTSLPMDQSLLGLGWRYNLIDSKSVDFILNPALAVFNYRWMQNIDNQQFHYADLTGKFEINFNYHFSEYFSILTNAKTEIAFDYENTDIDQLDFSGGIGLKIWHFKALANFEKSNLNQLYAVREAKAVYKKLSGRFGYYYASRKFKFGIGYQMSVSDYDDEFYYRKHEPKIGGGFINLNFCQYPTIFSMDMSYEKGNEIEIFKKLNFIEDPPIDIFAVKFAVRILIN